MNDHPFERALSLLIRPLARFALRHALKIQELTEYAKRALIEEASKDLASRNETKRVISRISAMTGIQRRDVMRFLSETKSEAPRSLIRKVIGAWIGDKRFQDQNGAARALTCEGSESEFALLVSAVSKDLNPYTVLRELHRANMVKRNGSKITLLHEVFTPRQDIVEGFRIVADDISDLTKAAEINLTAQAPQHLHIRTSYDNVSQAAVPIVRAWLIRKGEKLHADARRFLSRYDADINTKIKSKPSGARVVLGSFGICETMQEGRDEDSK